MQVGGGSEERGRRIDLSPLGLQCPSRCFPDSCTCLPARLPACSSSLQA